MSAATEHLHAGILILDWHADAATPLQAMLRQAGYIGIDVIAQSGPVRTLPHDGRYDLVLCDLQQASFAQAGIGGLTDPAGLPVFVIAADPSERLHALAAGVRDAVCRPFDDVELQTRIRNVLEVGMLRRKLEECNRLLEQKVSERTTELRESEARFQRFAELSSDWYWEQDASGKLTHFSGPVEEMLGIGHDATADALRAAGWDIEQHAQLREKIANREPFLDFIYSRTLANGMIQYMQVSCEPIFDRASAFAGYRGIGLDVTRGVRAA